MAIKWLREAPLPDVIVNTYRYIDQYIDARLDKEHAGYIVDRTGYPVFRDPILQGVTLNPEAEMADLIEFKGSPYIELGMQYETVVDLLGEPDNCGSALMANSCTRGNE